MGCEKVVEVGGGLLGVFTERIGAYITEGCLGILFAVVCTVCTGGETSWVVLFTLGVLCTGVLVTVGTLVWLVFTSDLL